MSVPFLGTFMLGPPAGVYLTFPGDKKLWHQSGEKPSETASVVVSWCVLGVLGFLRAALRLLREAEHPGFGPLPTSVPLLLSDLDIDVLGKISFEEWVLLLK